MAKVKRLPWSAGEVATLKSSHQTYGTGISKGSSTQIICRQWIFCLLPVLAGLVHLCHGDIGAAGQYTAPYLPTAYHDSDEGQFRPSELFGSAGEGIWDNGEACGRVYSVQCISAPDPTTCFPGQTVQVRIVDHALTSVSRPSRNDAAIVLSTTAFGQSPTLLLLHLSIYNSAKRLDRS